MGITVLTRAETARLVPLSTVKARLGITTTDEDTVLSELIDEVSAQFPALLGGLPLVRQRYKETLPGRDRTDILLSRWPVDPNSVTLTIDGTAATDFTVRSADTGVLWRETAWSFGAQALGQDPEENIEVTYHAGFIPAGSAAGKGLWFPWAAAFVYQAGMWTRPTSLSTSPLLMECTAGGTSHASTEPTWPTTAGQTVVDGTVTWTARAVHALPGVVSGLAFLAVRDLRSEARTPGTIAGMEADGVVLSRSISQLADLSGGVSKGVAAGLLAWRYTWPC